MNNVAVKSLVLLAVLAMSAGNAWAQTNKFEVREEWRGGGGIPYSQPTCSTGPGIVTGGGAGGGTNFHLSGTGTFQAGGLNTRYAIFHVVGGTHNGAFVELNLPSTPVAGQLYQKTLQAGQSLATSIIAYGKKNYVSVNCDSGHIREERVAIAKTTSTGMAFSFAIDCIGPSEKYTVLDGHIRYNSQPDAASTLAEQLIRQARSNVLHEYLYNTASNRAVSLWNYAKSLLCGSIGGNCSPGGLAGPVITCVNNNGVVTCTGVGSSR